MKRRLMIFVFFFSSMFCLVSCSFYSLNNYFDDWQSETDEQVVQILYRNYLYYEDEEASIEIEKGIIEEFYCVKNDRVYFCYSTALDGSPIQREWHIASTQVDGTDFKEHLPESAPLIANGSYVAFSYDYQAYGTCGGLYQDGTIFLKGTDRALVYNIEADTATEIESLPVLKYRYVIENAHKIVIEDTATSDTRTLTLDSMAKKNKYVEKMMELKSKKSWDGESYLSNFFANVRIIDDDIYLICEVFNRHGESFVLLFRYDFETDQVFYLTHIKSYDRAHHYSFALYDR